MDFGVDAISNADTNKAKPGQYQDIDLELEACPVFFLISKEVARDGL